MKVWLQLENNEDGIVMSAIDHGMEVYRAKVSDHPVGVGQVLYLGGNDMAQGFEMTRQIVQEFVDDTIRGLEKLPTHLRRDG